MKIRHISLVNTNLTISAKEKKVPELAEAKLFEGSRVYCPMYNINYKGSEYLSNVIRDERTLWIPNMVTHYRQEHITSWNKCWGYGGNRYRIGWFTDYDIEKEIVNERAKRQIIRKCIGYLIKNGITSTHFNMLQANDPETITLAIGKLENIKQN